MKNLTKPLGVSKKKNADKASGFSLAGLYEFPFVLVAVGLLGLISLTAAIWVVVVDEPHGGEPIVNVRIIEPKFDSENRTVTLVDVVPETKNNLSDQSPVGLSEVTLEREELLQPIDPSEILIYDPTRQTERSGSVSLSTVADKTLIEKSRYGFVPKIGEHGEKSFVAYSRPANAADGRQSQIAIIVGGLGLNDTITQSVLGDLPAETTLAFVPYADRLMDWMSRSRNKGHELLLQIPLEPFDFPNNDPGPKTLLVDNPWSVNEDQLIWLLSRMTNYVGVINYMGARYSASPEALRPLFKTLRDRGLMYVDDGSTPLTRAGEVAREAKIAYAQSSLVLDSLLTPEDIDARLLELEGLAREKGLAIGIASAFPVTVERLIRWVKDAEKRGIKLIPISATLDKSSF